MNIAIFIKRTTLHKGYGGLETQNLILSKEFVRNGHSVTVFAPKWELTQTEYYEDGINYILIDSPYRMLKLDKWIDSSIETFKKHHSINNFDIVFSQSSAGLGIIRNKKSLGIKVISICHGSALGEYKTLIQTFVQKPSIKGIFTILKNGIFVCVNYFGRQREFILHANKVIAVSGFVKNSIIDETFIPQDKVVVIKNGIEPPRIDIQKPNDIVSIIYVGQLLISKGILNLLNVYNKISKQYTNTQLVVVGDGPQKQDVVKFVDKNNAIKYLGKVSHQQVLENLTKSHIFVLPSLRQEGLPMSIVEAMFCKSVVVASDVGGISDAIDDTKTGFLIQQGNLDQLEDILTMLIKDTQKRNEISSNAFLKAQSDFTSAIMYKSYMEVIKSL